MAVVDPRLYSTGIAILLASIYVLKYTRIEITLRKAFAGVLKWLAGGNKKAGLQHVRETPITSQEELLVASKYPPRWWADEKQFQLERRAIFSKASNWVSGPSGPSIRRADPFQTWIFVTHASRFQKAGDYRTFEIAGFSFIIILGKDKQLRAFHNVCRHRAYAVTKKESGSSTVLGCRYHGWSYDTRGKLIKAPEFDNVTGFDKEMNGLWELNMKVREGMVFVNFQVSDDEESNFGEVENVMKMSPRWRIGQMKWAHEWKMEGAFNWKLAAETFSSETDHKLPCWIWISNSIFRANEHSVAFSQTSFVRVLPSGSLLTLRFLPLSSNRTVIECNIYRKTLRHTKATQAELGSIKEGVHLMVRRAECEQRQLVDGIGEIKKPALQDQIKQLLDLHRDDEERLGAEIHPAARKASFTAEGIADDDLCKELEVAGQTAACGANSKGLDW